MEWEWDTGQKNNWELFTLCTRSETELALSLFRLN